MHYSEYLEFTFKNHSNNCVFTDGVDKLCEALIQEK